MASCSPETGLKPFIEVPCVNVTISIQKALRLGPLL